MIRELLSIEDPAFVGFLELFIESFSAWGREPVPLLTQMLRERSRPPAEPYYRKWVAEQEGGVVGLVRGAYLPNAQVGFVVHIAVSKAVRKQGLARQLLDVAEAGFLDDANDRLYEGLLFEVERAQDGRTEMEREDRISRLTFFDRLGARLVTPLYTQPAMGSWLPAVPLNLLLRPQGAPELRRLVAAFYADAFGFTPDHPFVAKALDGVGPGLTSPLRDIADSVPFGE